MEDLSSLIPVIKRARGYRLYALSGLRYLDLSLGGGCNLPGHKPAGFVNQLKQVCEKGLLADLPSLYGKRLVKALRALFPGYQTFILASSRDELLETAGAALRTSIAKTDIHDPLLAPHPAGAIQVWRPFFTGNVMADIIFPVLPTGMGPSLFVLCTHQAIEPDRTPFPRLSPLVLAAALQSIHLLQSMRLPGYYRPDLLSSSTVFTQKDIYLVPRCAADGYREVFTRFLEKGVVLSPRYTEPSILPFELSPGELQNLLRLFDNQKEGTS